MLEVPHVATNREQSQCQGCKRNSSDTSGAAGDSESLPVEMSDDGWECDSNKGTGGAGCEEADERTGHSVKVGGTLLVARAHQPSRDHKKHVHMSTQCYRFICLQTWGNHSPTGIRCTCRRPGIKTRGGLGRGPDAGKPLNERHPRRATHTFNFPFWAESLLTPWDLWPN